MKTFADDKIHIHQMFHFFKKKIEKLHMGVGGIEEYAGYQHFLSSLLHVFLNYHHYRLPISVTAPEDGYFFSGDSARIQEETIKSFARFFTVLRV